MQLAIKRAAAAAAVSSPHTKGACSSSSISNSTRRRPLVVLAGWLGAQPQFLRRYEQLYRNRGFEVVCRIAPPYTIGREVWHYPREPLRRPAGWSESSSLVQQGHRHSPRGLVDDEPSSVQDLAWQILAEISTRQDNVSFWIFHSFSNGGCFVWERVRDILLQAKEQEEHGNSNTLLVELEKKLAGVVFDSCPIIELHRFNEALRHCSLLERAAVLRQNGWEMLRLTYDPKMKDALDQLCQDYAQRMRDDPLDIAQLYLYGRDDPLAPAPFIDELVEYRQKKIGKQKIVRCAWDTSVHCAHLLKHPQDYASAVESFIQLCASDREMRSKL